MAIQTEAHVQLPHPNHDHFQNGQEDDEDEDEDDKGDEAEDDDEDEDEDGGGWRRQKVEEIAGARAIESILPWSKEKKGDDVAYRVE